VFGFICVTRHELNKNSNQNVICSSLQITGRANGITCLVPFKIHSTSLTAHMRSWWFVVCLGDQLDAKNNVYFFVKGVIVI
jgi:hypothetical protein